VKVWTSNRVESAAARSKALLSLVRRRRAFLRGSGRWRGRGEVGRVCGGLGKKRELG